ncbi:MAG: hypothetical protein JNL39_08110 [Opitutaceae bacterium]|nr:hypothetical protein [Opitutaceae bacterium]
MISPSSLPSFLARRRFAGVTALVLSLVVGATAAAQQPKQGGAPEKKQHSFSEKLSEAFTKMKPLQEANDYAGMIKLLDSVPVVPGSYDEASVLNTKARIFAASSKYKEALLAWEKVVKLSDQHDYIPEKEILDIVYFLAQLNAQEATSIKDAAQSKPYFLKSVGYFRRFIDKTPKPTAEVMSTYASILYYTAVSDPNNPDQAMLKETREIIDRALTTAIKPKEGFYQLLLALYQQQNDLPASADLLELVLKQTPQKKDYWAMLFAVYLQLNDKNRDKDPGLAREYLVRAIVTLERAQALGFLNTPKDNMNLVSFYLLANQFSKGTELLYNGMKKGTIESIPHNWRILGRYYQEATMNTQAIAVLEEAAKLFPTNGEMEVQIANIYIQQENTREANKHAKLAVTKGNFDGTKPYSVHYLIAYTAYELGNMDEANAALIAAEKFEEHKKDGQFARLRDVVREALAEREAKLKPKDTPTKKDAPSTPPPAKTAPAMKSDGKAAKKAK